MANFDPVFEFLMKYEGGYVHDPFDHGGETKYGISSRSYPAVDIKHLTRDAAKEIYRNDFWNRLSGDLLPQPLALTLFDFAVNSGLATVVKQLQELLDLKVDGWFGPKTLAAAQGLDKTGINALVNTINDKRLQLYVRLSSSPTQRRFLLGWLRRLMALQRDL
jgi:lysozyme family protein